jgi:hypothetical protein
MVSPGDHLSGIDGAKSTSTAALTPRRRHRPAWRGRRWHGYNGAGAWINGRLAGVKIWNAVLSDAEVAAEYPYYDDIKGGAWAVYPMEQSGSRTNDVSGNARHLTEGGTLTSEADPPGVAWYVTGVNATASGTLPCLAVQAQP